MKDGVVKKMHNRSVWSVCPVWSIRYTSAGVIKGCVSTRTDKVRGLDIGEACRRVYGKPYGSDTSAYVLEYVCDFVSDARNSYVTGRFPVGNPDGGRDVWQWGASLIPVRCPDHAAWRDRVARNWGDATMRLAFSDWLEDREGVSFEVRLLRRVLIPRSWSRPS